MSIAPQQLGQLPTKLPTMQPVGMIDNELDHKGAWEYMSLLTLEDKQLRDPYITVADVGVAVFNWGDVVYDGQGFFPPQQIDVLRVNQIQNDTIAVTKTTFREPVAVELVCSDTGSYAPCYWAGPASAPMMQPVTDEMGQPLADPMTGQPAMQQTDFVASLGLMPNQIVGGMTDPMTGESSRKQPIDQMTAMRIEAQLAAAGLPAEWVVHADKRLVSSIYQTYYDGVWNDPKFAGQQWGYRFGLDANTMGWNTALVEWRDDIGVCIRPLSIKQAFFDRQHCFLKDSQHFIADFVFDVTYAKQQFPWIAAQIDAYKQTNGGTPIPVDGQTTWGQRDGGMFQRDIVTMRIGWFRDQPMPLSTQEAIDGGHIQEQFPAAPQGGIGDNVVGDVDATGDNPVVHSPAVPAGGNVGLPGSDQSAEPASSDATGTGMGSGVGIAPQVASYSLPDNTPVTPPTKGQPVDPNWPMKTCLRRIMAIAGRVVSDMPEDHWDIPILHLVCFPVTNTPYGTGIPFKCWQIQRSRTTVVQSIQENGQYFAHPMVAGPTDVIEGLGQDVVSKMWTRPNAAVKINPEYLKDKRIGDVFALVNPPPLPPSVIQGEQIMEKIQTQLSGNVAPLRGDVPESDQSSGRKVEALQSAAINQVNTGDDTEACFQRFAMLANHCHTKFATVDHVMKYYRKLPRDVLEAIHLDVVPDLHWEARVTVSTGGGMLKAQRRQDALQNLETIDQYTGKPVLDLQSAREEMDIDNEEVEERLLVQQQAHMQMQMAQMQQQPGANGQPAQTSNSNGNGDSYGR